MLRAGCEVREATYLASDIRLALTGQDFPAGMLGHRLSRLEEVAAGRAWWRTGR